ncbi:MAG TPA: response regulator transcription factor [Solirubrobacteraceae bacterium]|nr:response regulator transcription factor [Solirubrobacteraceae bacterium]
MPHLVLIEDEPGIADFVVRGLTLAGYRVESALDGETGLELALGDDVDLVVLDLMLPRMSGGEVLQRLTDRRPGLPVIVVTARGELEERVGGLKAGAVDYLVKPFAMDELEARIDAQLRASRQAPETTLRGAGLSVDLITRRVTHDGHEVRLSATEFELLIYFLHNVGRVLSREQILRAVWGYGHDPGTNIVDVYVGYLRRKLSGVDRRPVTITALRLRGYRLEDTA